MKQFGTIFSFELKHYLKNKVFVGVTAFLVLLIVAVMFFPRVMETFNNDSETDSAERAIMLIKTASLEKSDIMKEYFAAAFADYNVQSTEEDPAAIKERIISGGAECAFVMNSPVSYTYYVNNLSMDDANAEIANKILQNLYQMNTMIEYGMTMEQTGEIMSVQIDSCTESLGVNQIQNFFYTYIMIFALYLVIMLYGRMVASNVAAEKSSRAMELLITSAKPYDMMFGKVIASCCIGLLQLIAIFGTTLLSFRLNEAYWADNNVVISVFDMPIHLLVYMLIFFVLGFLIYAFLFGAVGSVVSKQEDIDTLIMPITVLFVANFIIVMGAMVSGNVDTVLMKVCSYVPFTSPMAMFTRIAMSTVPLYEILISTSILIASVIGTGFLTAQVYRVGVLLYGTTPKISSVVKAMWQK